MEVDQMQIGFMLGRSTIDTILFLGECRKATLRRIESFFICFVDFEKTFDWVPRMVIEWALRKKLVPVRLVQAVMSIYKRAKTQVQVEDRHTEEFDVGVGVHQGSVF